jgi:hypothetical protein
MIISIPTRGRVGNQITLGFLPESWTPDVHVWCPEEEIEQHKRYPYAGKVGHWHEAPLGMAASRQAQLDWASASRIEWLWFMDDDLKFQYRPPGIATATNFTGPRAKMMPELKNRVLGFRAETYRGRPIAMIGVSKRRRLTDEQCRRTEEYATRIFGSWAVHVPTVFKEGIRLDALGPLFPLDDFYIQLSLLTKGYASVCLTDFANRAAKSNAPGGCSIYRTPQAQAEFAGLLAEAFPKFVTLRAKGSGGWDVDVRVAWKEALNLCELES